jgi:hypothetical protein
MNTFISHQDRVHFYYYTIEGNAFNFSVLVQGSASAEAQALLAHPHDAAQALALEHQVEGRVDLRERHTVRNELFQLQLLSKAPQIDQSGNTLKTCLNTIMFRTPLLSRLPRSSEPVLVILPSSCTSRRRWAGQCAACSCRRRSPSVSSRSGGSSGAS